MNKVVLPIFMILTLAVSAGYADNTDDISKNKKGLFELGIGGIYSTAGFMDIARFQYGFHDESYNEVSAYQGGYEHKCSFSIFFDYFIRKNYAVGASAELGYIVVFPFGLYPYLYNIYGNTRLVNKAGNSNKNKFFYSEIGIDLSGEFTFQDMYVYGFAQQRKLFLGPGLFLGYNHTPLKKFSYMIGMSFSSLFYLGKSSFSIYDDIFSTRLTLGVETRFYYRIERNNLAKAENEGSNNISSVIQIRSRMKGELYINDEHVKTMEPGEEMIYDKLKAGNYYKIKIIYYQDINGENKAVNHDIEEIYIQPGESYILNFNLKEEEIKNKYWKRHFFEILTGAGFSYTKVLGSTENKDGTYTLGIFDLWNGSSSLSLGYIYGFNKTFGFGASLSGAVSFPQIWSSGFAILASFMFGDLDNQKIAFLLDVGGGMFFMQKFGIYIKGFIFKFSHCLGFGTFHMGSLSGMHDFTFEFGYMINWKRKHTDNHKLFIIPSS